MIVGLKNEINKMIELDDNESIICQNLKAMFERKVMFQRKF